MKRFAFINQKGGVGKTTLAVNLGRALSLLNKKVLIVDFDPQANASSALGIKVEKKESIYQALIEENCEKFIKKIYENLYLLPSSIDLVGLEVELLRLSKRERVLKEFLDTAKIQNTYLEEFFDFIFIDSPPSLSIISVNILVASEGVIIPLQCEYFALEGLSLLVRTIRRIKKSFNPELKLFGMVLTMYDSRNRLSHEIAEEAKKYFPWLLFKTIIPRSVKVSEATSYGKPIIDYAKNHKVSQAFLSLAKEFLERCEVNLGIEK